MTLATQVLLIIIGISSGAVIASGFFSFVISLGIVSKFADRTRTGDSVLAYENAITLGGITGSCIFIFKIAMPFAYVFLPLIGLAAGIFVGCWAMSIAEVINVFPILVRRIKLVAYIKYIVISVALGKGIGMWIMSWKR